MVAPVGGSSTSNNTQSQKSQSSQNPQRPEQPKNDKNPPQSQQPPQKSPMASKSSSGDGFSGGGIPKTQGSVSPLAGTQSQELTKKGTSDSRRDAGGGTSNPFAAGASRSDVGVSPAADAQNKGGDASRDSTGKGAASIKTGAPKAEGANQDNKSEVAKATLPNTPQALDKIDAKAANNPLQSAIDKKDWAGVRSQLSESIKNGTFNAKDLQQAVRAGADLKGMDFSTLNKGQLDNQRFQGPKGEDGKPVTDLSGSFFSDLKGTQFENLKLNNARFLRSMSDVSFNNVEAARSNFRNNADRHNVELKNVQFNNSDFSRALFGDVRSDYPMLFDNKPTALNGVTAKNSNFSGASLGGSTIENSTFQGSDFSYAFMNDATLKNNQMQGNNFSNAFFKESTLSNNNFSNSSFQESAMGKANLTGNQFKNADLRGVGDFDQVGDKNNFEGAKYSDLDKLPANLDPAKAGMAKTGLEGLSSRTRAIMESKATGQMFPSVRGELDKLGINPNRLKDNAQGGNVVLAPTVAPEGGKFKGPDIAPTGSGRNIAQIEQNREEHAADVRSMIKGSDSFEGLAPNADVQQFSYEASYPSNTGPAQDSQAGFNQWLDEQGTYLLNGSAEAMKHIANEQAKPPIERAPRGPGLQTQLPPIMPTKYDATSQSEAWTKSQIYQMANTALNSGQFPNSSQAVYGSNADKLNEHQKAQKLVDYIHNHLNPQTNAALKQAISGFDKQAQRLLSQGTVPFVGTANQRGDLPFQQKPAGAPADWKPPVTIPKGFDTSLLMYSPNVFGVGATDTQATPSLADDKMTDFSSYGNGKQNPFAVAPGINIPTNKTFWGNYETFGGTSAATPIAAATAAMMREVNPNITPQQILGAMQFSAVKQPGVPAEAQGAGSLDIPRAVRLSKLLGELTEASPFQLP